MKSIARTIPALLTVALAATISAGCSNDKAMSTDDMGGSIVDDAGGGKDFGPDLAQSACPSTLSLISSKTQNLAPAATAELRVRLLDCNAAFVANAGVKFALGAGSTNSKLSALSVQTDQKGEAAVTLTAGDPGTMFDVNVTADNAAAVSFQVKVGTFSTGSIVVTMSYGGKLAFTEYQATLFEAEVCTRLNPYNLPQPALAQSAALKSINDRPNFNSLAPALDYTVVVTAKLAGKILGWGCADGQQVKAGNITTVPIAVSDIPVSFQGIYELDNHFDLTGVLPPSVAQAVNIINEMTNDKGEPGVNGNPMCVPTSPAPRYCGTDPAAFMLDLVYGQFCKWECAAGTNFSTCTPMNHPTGDLSALYTENFMTWSGAQPYAPTLCGQLEITHPTIEALLNTEINNLIPSFALKLLNILGDLTEAIKHMHLTSELSITRNGTEKTGNFTHVMKEMILTVHDFSTPPVATEHRFNLANAGLTNLMGKGVWATAMDGKLTIPPHDFQLDMGKLVWYIYSQIILPTINPTWHSSTDLLKAAINCNSCSPPAGQTAGLGCDLYNNIGVLSDASYQMLCSTAITVGGAAIDSAIQSSIAAKTIITLQGTADGDLINDQQIADALKNGIWMGKWTEGNSTGNFPGTFTGTR